MSEYLPRWLRELRRFQLLRPQIYLYGNVYDCYYLPLNYRDARAAEELTWVMFPDLRGLLQQYLRTEGYELICYYDEIDGLELTTTGQAMTKPELLGMIRQDSPEARGALPERVEAIETDVQRSLAMFRYLLAGRRMLTAAVVNYGSRFAGDPNLLQRDERRLYLEMLKAAQHATVFPDRGGARNLLIVLCDKLNDIPPWLLVDNPLTRGICIRRPERDERRRFFDIVGNRRAESRFYEIDGSDAGAPYEAAVDRTDGFTNRELENLVSLSRHERIPLSELARLIDLYRYGERENFWEQLDPERIRGADEELSERVLGQPRAVRKAVEILRRAQLGLDDIDRSGSNRPKGVLFFAGPTGVGKTELAKGLAALVFNDESALLRFDMSEYSDSNSAVKFIGAPPGYVGYEEGGQLTRRIAERPFSIVLFDEIEKAHPSVFDKFLQILDDGRLTDSKGETVYFSETLVVFTSNLGVFREDPDRPGHRVPNVDIDNSYEEVSDAIMREIREFFASRLNRPEILNRFGDNFVVFDFIRHPVDGQILRKRLDVVAANLEARLSTRLRFDEQAVEAFRAKFVADNLINGGRGINNRIETYVKNPLATYLFEHPEARGRTLAMRVDGTTVRFECVGD